jgi:hypothetical protein
MFEVFTLVGGMRADLFNASWPFARLTATKEKICLQVFSRKYEIDKSAINKLKKYKGIFSTGLKIEHQNHEIPGRLIFWTFSFKKLKLVLEQMGYKVEA